MLGVYINNTGDHPKRPDYGNYEVVVCINGQRIAEGIVKNHYRRNGWRNLLWMIAKSRAVKKL